MAAEAPPSGHDTMSPAIAGTRNYYAWIFRTLAPWLGGKVLEIGPGWGQMLDLITASGREYWAVDSDGGIIGELAKRYPAAAGRLLQGDVTAEATAARPREAGVDTILIMNVLEHIEDDAAFLKALKARFPGSRVVLQLPALPLLYGRMDREAGHFRRYTTASAAAALEAAGYAVEKDFYFNFVGALTWFASSRLAGLSLNSGPTQKAILFNDRFIIPLSFLFEPFTRKLAGQSVIAVARP